MGGGELVVLARRGRYGLFGGTCSTVERSSCTGQDVIGAPTRFFLARAIHVNSI